MRPYWVWTNSKGNPIAIDLTKASFMYPQIWLGGCKIKVSYGGMNTRLSDDYVLDNVMDKEEAMKYIKTLMYKMNSGKGEPDTRPLIRKIEEHIAPAKEKRSIRDSLLCIITILEDAIREDNILSQNQGDAKATLQELQMCQRELCKITINFEEDKSCEEQS